MFAWNKLFSCSKSLQCRCSLQAKQLSRTYVSKQRKIKRSAQLSPHVAKSKIEVKSKKIKGSVPAHLTSNPVKKVRGNVPGRLTANLPSGGFSKLREVESNERIKFRALLEKIDSFEALKIQPDIRRAIMDGPLGKLEIRKPTVIQTLGIKIIRSRPIPSKRFDLHTYMLAAETGSGKTLAYLAPLLSELKDQENEPEWNLLKDAAVVRSIILVPTVELVNQVATTIEQISQHLDEPINYFACSHEVRGKQIQAKITKRTDVLISTPDKMLRVFEQYPPERFLEPCKFIVVDEADSLMDESFIASTQKAIQLATNIEKLVFCSATIPRKFDRSMRALYPDAIRIVSPSVHKMPGHVEFRVVEVFRSPYNDNKFLALQQALFAIHHDGTEPGLTKRVVVFVNNKNDVDKLANDLNDKGYPTVGVSGKVPSAERKRMIEDFVTLAKPAPESGARVKTLVTTDIMARGIDMQNVKNIILYDLPYSSVDLLHRSGRTGRLGRRGRVFLLINRKESQGWVKGLEKVIKKGLALA